MRSILGCTISDALVDRWISLLVYEHAPFFMPDGAQSLLPKHAVTFTRAEFSRAAPNLEFCDSYMTWAVQAQATLVVLLSPTEFRTLPHAIQQTLMHWQWQFGRGQVYDTHAIRPLLTVNEWAAIQAYALFATPDGDKVALDYALWHTMARPTQWRWLEHFLTQDRKACVCNTFTNEQWNHVAMQHGPYIRHLAGSFASSSGPNCFSTTLAAATRSYETATTIAAGWLSQVPFARGLAARGYTLDTRTGVTTSLPARTILVWVDEHDTMQHACYVLDAGLVLNKDAQTWYAPRQLLPMAAVIEQWQEDNLRILVYSPTFDVTR